MKKPLIVLTPQAMPMEEPFRQEYLLSSDCNFSAITRAGGIPILPPFVGDADAQALLTCCDGLLLTGGADVAPALYGEEALPSCGKPDPRRDASDLALLRAALKLHKPVFCICRGFQLANVYLGGTLWQDLPTQHPTPLCHRDYPGYAEPVAHTVRLLPGTGLQQLLDCETLPVNSLHHQAIRTLAPALRPCAVAPDGIIEGWELPDPSQWLRGVQWHPEKLQDSPQSDAIFSAFLRACQTK